MEVNSECDLSIKGQIIDNLLSFQITRLSSLLVKFF